VIILTAALNYTEEIVRPFLNSLRASGYPGSLVVLVNSKTERAAFPEGTTFLEDPRSTFPINTRRFLAFRDFLKGSTEPCLLCDIRDIVFQGDPSAILGLGINVTEEDRSMVIGSCPYNSDWMTKIFGEVRHSDKPILCAGTTWGDELATYTAAMWSMLSTLPPIIGLDQAVHNHLVYGNHLAAYIHANEESPVYTVGYIPRETVSVVDEKWISNKAGEVDTIIHQWDRHQNLKKLIEGRYL